MDGRDGCDCITATNRDLAEYNCAIVTNLLGPSRAFVETYVLKAKRGFRAPKLQASYCPFCGVKYPDKEDAS